MRSSRKYYSLEDHVKRNEKQSTDNLRAVPGKTSPTCRALAVNTSSPHAQPNARVIR